MCVCVLCEECVWFLLPGYWGRRQFVRSDPTGLTQHQACSDSLIAKISETALLSGTDKPHGVHIDMCALEGETVRHVNKKEIVFQGQSLYKISV